METRARLSPVKSTRRRIIVNPNSDYYDHSYQKEKQQPKLLDSVKQQIKDYGHLTQGFEDEDIDDSNNNLFTSGLIDIDEIYNKVEKAKQENKSLVAQQIVNESDLSKLQSLNLQIHQATKRNKELTVESKLFSMSFKLGDGDLNVSPLVSIDAKRMDKYDRCLYKIQKKFKKLQEEIQGKEDLKEPVLCSSIDEEIYKEQQETKLLRLKYESVLDGLDKQIAELEGLIEDKNKLMITKTILLNGIRRKIYFINRISTEEKDTINNEEQREKEERSRKYSKMKEINKKYSSIVLVKSGSLKQKLDSKIASHSLDLGVPNNGNVYKPNLGRIKSVGNYNSTSRTIFKTEDRDFKADSMKINIRIRNKNSKELASFTKPFYKDIKMHKENGDLKSPVKHLEDYSFSNNETNGGVTELPYDPEEDQFDRWRKIFESRKNINL